MPPGPSQAPLFVQSRHHLAPIGNTRPTQVATCIAQQPSSTFSPLCSPSLPPCPAPLILFVGILVQAKPCGQGQMLQRPSLPPQLQAARVKEEVGITHITHGQTGCHVPQHPAPSLALPRTWGLKLNQTMALTGLDWQVGMRWPVTALP